jgi:rRNA maturation RNase YbeY
MENWAEKKRKSFNTEGTEEEHRERREEHRPFGFSQDKLKPVLLGEMRTRRGVGVRAIENHQRGVRVEIGPLEEFLQNIREEIGLGPECVAVRLIGDAEMARLNETYRKKKGPTDVLSFPAAEDSAKPGTLKQQVRKARGEFLGDIAISPRVARRNAKSLGRRLPEELKVLILHGVLHLLGYDHETDRGEMERIERRLRRKMGIA